MVVWRAKTSTLCSPQVCVYILIICNNRTLIRDGRQKLSDWGNIKPLGLPYLIGQYYHFQSSSLRSSYTCCGKIFGFPVSGYCVLPPMIQVPSLQYSRNLFLLTRYSSLKAGRPWKRCFCPFWLDLAGPCTHKIGFVSGCLSADGDKFLSVRLMFKFCGQKALVCTRSRKLKRRQSYAVCVHEWLMHFFHIFYPSNFTTGELIFHSSPPKFCQYRNVHIRVFLIHCFIAKGFINVTVRVRTLLLIVKTKLDANSLF